MDSGPTVYPFHRHRLEAKILLGDNSQHQLLNACPQECPRESGRVSEQEYRLARHVQPSTLSRAILRYIGGSTHASIFVSMREWKLCVFHEKVVHFHDGEKYRAIVANRTNRLGNRRMTEPRDPFTLKILVYHAFKR